MIHLVTFSAPNMDHARALCISSALKHGVDSIAGPHYFDPGIEYRDGFTLDWLKSQPIYEQMGAEWWTKRGIGYWFWKSYLIDLVMSKLPDGDILIYADAGIEFIDNVRYIVDRMGHDKPQDDVWLFGNNWEHAHWCKRDVIEAVWPQLFTRAPMTQWMEHAAGAAAHPTWNRFGKQCQASVIFFRVSDWSHNFVNGWLAWCMCSQTQYQTLTDGDGQPYSFPTSKQYLIDDSPSIAPNHPEFREHRHDQAILTTLAYREGIKLHYWPASYNDGAFTYEKIAEYAGDDYPVLFHHHRKRNHEWENAA
jgi:hypothetical protein